ncbi:MAG: MFS transporter [Spirochaetales bacterium]|uniref:MFS transporter n=1 Tax=Bullifex sp. TaxID=2815808 RepID=UPI002A4F15AF|nr:MFS transporter [Bullifex sp.]MDD7271572.1 MFS transporter [Spirochaetales bacterium]MDY4067871.1 MFS transporter [Bullifex sp.]
MSKKKSLKGYYLTTFLIGLGFFTMGLMDPLYDTYVPIFLGKYISSNSLIGTIMTLDNVLAIFLIPIFSAFSDRIDTKIGRRMPFIITLLPLAALAFGLIPISALSSLWALVLLIFVLNLAKQAVRGPVVALMPDMVPGDLRSEANGVINTMGGIATILGTILLARLMNVKVTLPKFGVVDNVLAFPVASIFVIIAVVLLFIFVKEKKSTVRPDDKEEEEKREPILKSLKVVLGEKNKSALYILISLLCWFIAYQGVLPFVGKYSVEVLGTSSGTASLAAGMVGIAYAIFAIPSGKFAHKHGRKKTIRGALICLVTVLILVFLHGVLLKSLPPTVKLLTFWALLFCFGIFWVTIVTNSFPMLWQMSTFSTVGIYTGLYYFFSQAASIISPPLSGACIDIFGYPSLFIYAAIFMTIAFITMSKVDRGEPEDGE